MARAGCSPLDSIGLKMRRLIINLFLFSCGIIFCAGMAVVKLTDMKSGTVNTEHSFPVDTDQEPTAKGESGKDDEIKDFDGFCMAHPLMGERLRVNCTLYFAAFIHKSYSEEVISPPPENAVLYC